MKEPGYFACYLSLALVFNLIYSKGLWNWKNIILILAMITTFSTAGYIMLFFIFIFFCLINKEMRYAYKIFMVIIFLFLSITSFYRLDFLSGKIEYHYLQQVERRQTWGRFGAVMINVKELIEHPIIGKGLLKQTRFDESDFKVASGRYIRDRPWLNLNSWTAYMVRLGLIGFILFIILYIKSIKVYLKNEKLEPNYIYLIFGTLFIGLSAQPIIETPIFFSFLYFNDVKSNKLR